MTSDAGFIFQGFFFFNCILILEKLFIPIQHKGGKYMNQPIYGLTKLDQQESNPLHFASYIVNSF